MQLGYRRIRKLHIPVDYCYYPYYREFGVQTEVEEEVEAHALSQAEVEPIAESEEVQRCPVGNQPKSIQEDKLPIVCRKSLGQAMRSDRSTLVDNHFQSATKDKLAPVVSLDEARLVELLEKVLLDLALALAAQEQELQDLELV